ncbi:HDL452Wp [Eremothecium sinecaudum]|uniref:HDL452Wp n=1 Tax=Eremothecium sinecaudum TaxID=45286 RepID=A0A0X8HRU4_9SACH|nr:HDL452Wp [Eremothecium sinecaudum]AMD20292.1 HDL452Wp [Eremothecium sinecaudum]
MEAEIRYSLNATSRDIKKEYTSLRNRLQSIILDNKYMCDEVIPSFPDYPIIPNERCGLWYCRPGQYEQTSYFKSTDGHTAIWDFSVRRLNFHLLPTLSKHNGLIIVDSTRRGKKMPDALSKTIPIWCAVLNNLILEFTGNQQQVLFCPPDIVSPTEYSSIVSKLPHLVEKLKKIDQITGEKLFAMFGGRTLRPFWVYPGSSLLNVSKDIFTGEMTGAKWSPPENVIPLILYTASYQCQDGVDNKNGFTYVQGAADDHELWAGGLTSNLLWKHFNVLGDPTKSESELASYCQNLLTSEADNLPVASNLKSLFKIDVVNSSLHLAAIRNNTTISKEVAAELEKNYSLTIVCSETVAMGANVECKSIKIYPMNSDSKKGSRTLRITLIEIDKLISDHLKNKTPIMICCNTGRDISVGVVLTILCRHFDLDWLPAQQISINKTVVRKHLAKLISHMDGRNLNPSRATLNSINSFLMQ